MQNDDGLDSRLARTRARRRWYRQLATRARDKACRREPHRNRKGQMVNGPLQRGRASLQTRHDHLAVSRATQRRTVVQRDHSSSRAAIRRAGISSAIRLGRQHGAPSRRRRGKPHCTARCSRAKSFAAVGIGSPHGTVSKPQAPHCRSAWPELAVTSAEHQHQFVTARRDSPQLATTRLQQPWIRRARALNFRGGGGRRIAEQRKAKQGGVQLESRRAQRNAERQQHRSEACSASRRDA